MGGSWREGPASMIQVRQDNGHMKRSWNHGGERQMGCYLSTNQRTDL